jgi:hypothetical protein
VRGNNRNCGDWYLDSGCSNNMTGNESHFLSLTAFDGGSVTFGDNKKGEVLGIGTIGKSPSHYIKNVYLVKGLHHNLLSISQMCDKDNYVLFTSDSCTIAKKGNNETVLKGRRVNNVYKVSLNTLPRNSLSCLSAIQDSLTLWHERLGHASYTLINKLRTMDLVEGLPNVKFQCQKVCDACAKGKQVRSSFKLKNLVSTTKPLELIHIDLCGPMRTVSRGGSRYVLVIVDDFSRFTWTIFIASKDETFEEFVIVESHKSVVNLVSVKPFYIFKFRFLKLIGNSFKF